MRQGLPSYHRGCPGQKALAKIQSDFLTLTFKTQAKFLGAGFCLGEATEAGKLASSGKRKNA